MSATSSTSPKPRNNTPSTLMIANGDAFRPPMRRIMCDSPIHTVPVAAHGPCTPPPGGHRPPGGPDVVAAGGVPWLTPAAFPGSRRHPPPHVAQHHERRGDGGAGEQGEHQP